MMEDEQNLNIDTEKVIQAETSPKCRQATDTG